MEQVIAQSTLARLLFVSHSTHPLGHVSDLEVFRSATRHNNANGISGVILRGETWFCQVLEGDQKALTHTWQRICVDPRHANHGHWWQTDIRRRMFSNWHTEHWGVSPQIEQVFVDMIQSPTISTEDKIILVRAFAQVRRARSQQLRSAGQDSADARLDNGHLSKAIDAL